MSRISTRMSRSSTEATGSAVRAPWQSMRSPAGTGTAGSSVPASTDIQSSAAGRIAARCGSVTMVSKLSTMSKSPSVARTRTVKELSALRPPASRAATVTVAVPCATATMWIVSPGAATPAMAATPLSEETAPWMSASPSGSMKYPDTSTRAVSATANLRSGIAPEATGARFGTVTSKRSAAARPSGSRAVIATVDVPGATETMRIVLPETPASATSSADDLASKESTSPSGSRK